jgi:PAS domain S-box-containing protein
MSLLSRLWFATPLARRLMLVLILALLGASGMLVGGALWITGSALQIEHESSARRLAGLFEASLHSAMLRRDLPGLAEILVQLGGLPGVQFAALLNPAGEVRFASRPSDQGRQHPEWVRELCLSPGCKDSPARLDTLDGHKAGLLRIAYPIRNQARCSGCHGAADAHPVNGVLVVEFVPPSEGSGALQLRRLLPLGLAALGLLVLAIWWVVRREVLAPVGRLAAVAGRVADGDLTARVGCLGGGELGRLGGEVDTMTERLGQMLHQASQQGAFLQGLVDAAPDPMVVIDDDYRIVLANRAYSELVRQPLETIRGQSCHRVGRQLDEPCPVTLVTCPLAELRARPEALRTLMNFKRPDGSPVSVEIHAAPLVGPDGRRLVVEAIRSLDDQVRFSQEQRLSAVGLLANGVAHEIHNPLASIRLALQSSLRGLRNGSMDAAEVTEYLELVDAEIDRCVLTTQRLMSLSHPPGPTRPVLLGAAIGDMVALLAEEARNARVTVNIDLQPADARVLGDEAEMRQVSLNLLQNAFHAMPDGGRLDVCLRREGGHYHLTMRDTGVGIPVEDQPLIFMPFFSRRADGRRGSGLGLAICKAIVERHGGRIRVESQPGQGSTFHVFLACADGENP